MFGRNVRVTLAIANDVCWIVPLPPTHRKNLMCLGKRHNAIFTLLVAQAYVTSNNIQKGGDTN